LWEISRKIEGQESAHALYTQAIEPMEVNRL
jgi:hypothetical protein